LVRTAVLIGCVAALATAAWLQLVDSSFHTIEVGRILALALAPAFVVLLTGRWKVGVALALLALVPAAGYALDVPVTDMRRGDHDFWGPLFDAVHDGFSDFYDTRVPLAPADHPEMWGLVLLAIFLTVAIPALLLAARRPLAAGVAVVLGIGWPLTLAATIPGKRALPLGAVLFAAIIILLVLTREGRRPVRRIGPALILGIVLVLAAVGASTTAAVAKPAFLEDWQRWNYDPEPDVVGVRYVWSSNYTGIKFPDKPTVVLRIKAPKRNLYWRATTLDEYTGVGWREDLSTEAPAVVSKIDTPTDEPLLGDDAGKESGWTRQDVTVEALADTHLVAAATPMRIDTRFAAPMQYAPGGIVILPDGLDYQQRYSVWSYAPRVDTTELAELSAAYPAELDRYLEVVPDVRFPTFGQPSRQKIVRDIFIERSFDTLLAEYRPLYRKALDVVEGAKTPYVAVASLEAWFRSQGGFVYDEQPPPYGSDPPLVTFVLEHKAGYCQQFAGAMAVMLRLLGIPARVAAGFTSGKYDERRGEWVVTDFNAHTWVEAWFPKYGWLPFDPTPGRGTLAGAYSTSSATFGEGADFPTALGTAAPAALQALLEQRLEGLGSASARRGAGEAASSGAVSNDDGGGAATIAGLVFLVLACALGLVLGVKEVRRRVRFLGRDPRHEAAACRRDLIAFLADQGVVFPSSTTLADVGHYVERRYRVNATPFVHAATEARFGQPSHSADAARRARRELKTLLRQLRRQITVTRRARGALSLRSLAV
jgi:transglutaminase-like putative cysteine protease